MLLFDSWDSHHSQIDWQYMDDQQHKNHLGSKRSADVLTDVWFMALVNLFIWSISTTYKTSLSFSRLFMHLKLYRIWHPYVYHQLDTFIWHCLLTCWFDGPFKLHGEWSACTVFKYIQDILKGWLKSNVIVEDPKSEVLKEALEAVFQSASVAHSDQLDSVCASWFRFLSFAYAIGPLVAWSCLRPEFEKEREVIIQVQTWRE